MRVLIVEDEVIIALDIVHQLKAIGYDTISIVTSGEEALRIAKKSPPDLVMMDIKIKGQFDGIYIAKELYRRFQTPIIFISAFSDEETKREANIDGPVLYIQKPFSLDELRNAIKKITSKSS